jgi:hypothetical protein
MAKCEEQGFSGVTSAHFGAFIQKAASLGMPGLDGKGPKGQASAGGFTLGWDFDEATSTLKVQCLEAPMLLPCAMINAKIREAVAEVLASTNLAAEPAKG